MMINSRCIKGISILGGEAISNLEPTPLNMDRVKQRYAKAVNKAKEEAAKINKNVSQEDQSIFNAISKTLPCAWDDRNIIVLDTITITPPYTPDDCSGDNIYMLQRVQKVIGHERAKGFQK
ncbi:hypothetical protein SARC_00209 [Sphaeroforma arctica JP610]|uniref:AD domain-containing protein n=1 Tax=Sphaeroforma arctica JP610 TaxID=667725 RepID=A0A0L0GH95_9EUKA|nr:hypothetical protein SARC_00209 [Sphaeroforma arctica JP610]KNC87703.1 hypothetical protein SARC_00209 [Sphaeroforma arctica JP610]|eukprot:XP_014161605.1 hypothetical protein SARC_00209 [Sphaeroforma arctica JP610]